MSQFVSDNAARRPMIAGNWKMHGTCDQVLALLQGLLLQLQELHVLDSDHASAVEVVVFPPAPFLAQVKQLLERSQIAWGGQNLCAEADSQGAFTGEVSAAMLADFACQYVLVGHSERRHYYTESAQTLAAKMRHAIAHGIQPIYCMGETLAQREAGETEAVLEKQLATWLALSHNQPQVPDSSRAVVCAPILAYEPVWAIGTGVSASCEQAQRAHAFLRQRIAQDKPQLAQRTRILYGGSVKPANAAELLQQVDIDGALVGGASLDVDSFVEIIKQCTR